MSNSPVLILARARGLLPWEECSDAVKAEAKHMLPEVDHAKFWWRFDSKNELDCFNPSVGGD